MSEQRISEIITDAVNETYVGKQWTRTQSYTDAENHLAEAVTALNEGRTILARNHLRVTVTRCSGWNAATMPAKLATRIANVALMLCDRVANDKGYTAGYIVSARNKESGQS